MTEEIVLREEKEHGHFTELYRSAGLEIEDDWVEVCGAVMSVAAWRGETLLGAATVSRRFDRLVLDYVAVEPEERESGIGKLLVDRCLRFVRDAGEDALWLAARTPGFFRAIGGVETGGDTLLGECVGCEDFGIACKPIEMLLRI